MSAGYDLSDCRCVGCGAAALGLASDDDGAATRLGAFACGACGARFDRVWGVPFLFAYEEADFAGLTEIVANAHQLSPFTPALLDHWSELLSKYDQAEDRVAFQATVDPASAPWLPHRHVEWLQVEALAGDLDIRGRKVLDVGAGLGFDSYRHVRAGADVTAVEFSPVLAREGARNLPMIRWFGGASHALPFVDASFDAVFSNAALHHMRDIPSAMEEMLRVLRPGGTLITTGDAYRKASDGESVELAIFNCHPGVLGGINERVPRFSEFVEVLERHRRALEPRLFTSIVYEAWLAAGRRTVEGMREWPFRSASKSLRRTSGSLALRVTLLRPTAIAAKQLRPGKSLSAATLAGWLSDQPGAMAQLAAWAPESLVNAPFPRGSEKADLLNGWRLKSAEAHGEAYLRGRWYLRRAPAETALAFEVCSSTRATTFNFILNGKAAGTVDVAAGAWTRVCVDISESPPDTPFCFEIKLADLPELFEHGLFSVRERCLQSSELS